MGRNYENRPMMCWDYPYGDKCSQCGATGPDRTPPETLVSLEAA